MASDLKPWARLARPALLIPLVLLLSAPVAPAARGQATEAIEKKEAAKPAAAPSIVQEPVARRVFQRDVNDRADIPIVLDPGVEDATIVSAQLVVGPGQEAADQAHFADGKLVGVPTGGPYTISGVIRVGNTEQQFTAGPVFVGDLWVLAGQSNMQGVGDLVDVTPPSDQVMALGMDGKWVRAEEPLHWLVDSPDPVHSGDPATREERSKKEHQNRKRGAGLGLPFGVAVAQQAGVPIGLVICAHGGTSMEQWNPSKKDEGGKSLYGSMMRQFQLAGGKVKGLLWYQGESDAGEEPSQKYAQVFADFITAVRSDFGQPELPFYLVQIGRFVIAKEPPGWKVVQEAQRLIPDRVPNTAVVSVIDLELDDLIHVGTQGLKRAGHRLAQIALREQYGQVGGTTPTFDKVLKGPNKTLLVKFKGVNMPPAHGMGGMGMGMGGMGGPGMMAAQPGGGAAGRGMMGGMGMRGRMMGQGGGAEFGLRPARHIAGFSIRAEDGSLLPLIYEAAVGQARDTVVLKLAGDVPEGARLWYGYGLDPYCNLTDSLDMAVPVFGPIPLDDVK